MNCEVADQSPTRVMHPLDRLEVALTRGVTTGSGQSDVAELLAADLVHAAEFIGLRWLWWRDRQLDLLHAVPDLRAWPALGALVHLAGNAEVLQPSGRLPRTALPDTRGLGVEELPPFGNAWEAGGTVMTFAERFSASLHEAGIDRKFAYALSGALREMASNAVEHAFPPVRPLACFAVGNGQWSFGVTDVGRGVLASLRENPEFAHLTTESHALGAALQDGVSRSGRPGRGFGFTVVFKALVDRRATLRFRSGGSAAFWEGESPTAQTIACRGLPLARTGFHVRVAGPLGRRPLKRG